MQAGYVAQLPKERPERGIGQRGSCSVGEFELHLPHYELIVWSQRRGAFIRRNRRLLVRVEPVLTGNEFMNRFRDRLSGSRVHRRLALFVKDRLLDESIGGPGAEKLVRQVANLGADRRFRQDAVNAVQLTHQILVLVRFLPDDLHLLLDIVEGSEGGWIYVSGANLTAQAQAPAIEAAELGHVHHPQIGHANEYRFLPLLVGEYHRPAVHIDEAAHLLDEDAHVFVRFDELFVTPSDVVAQLLLGEFNLVRLAYPEDIIQCVSLALVQFFANAEIFIGKALGGARYLGFDVRGELLQFAQDGLTEKRISRVRCETGCRPHVIASLLLDDGDVVRQITAQAVLIGQLSVSLAQFPPEFVCFTALGEPLSAFLLALLLAQELRRGWRLIFRILPGAELLQHRIQVVAHGHAVRQRHLGVALQCHARQVGHAARAHAAADLAGFDALENVVHVLIAKAA